MELTLSIVAVLTAAAALGVALYRADSNLKTLRKAFRVLEADVEDQFERVESHLGRISRLKRTLGVKSDASDGQKPGDVEQVTPITAPRSRASLLARMRQKNGDFARKLRQGT